MPNIVIRMSDEQRARLEAYRAANGLRSLNAAMLHLIDTRGGTVKPYMDSRDADFFSATVNTAGTVKISRSATGVGSIQVGPTTPPMGSRLKQGKTK
jgi:hypothetical protein